VLSGHGTEMSGDRWGYVLDWSELGLKAGNRWERLPYVARRGCIWRVVRFYLARLKIDSNRPLFTVIETACPLCCIE
jgi:hypothetical protein